MTRETIIYIAGPLFSVAEREFNKKLCEALNKEIKGINVILPQEFTSAMSNQSKFIQKAFKHSLESIENSDIVIAILDGPDVDSGTCIEIGYAYSNKKPIVGLRTDFRTSEDKGVNLMVSRACTHFIWLKNPSMELEYTLNKVVKSVKTILSKTNRHTASRVAKSSPHP